MKIINKYKTSSEVSMSLNYLSKAKGKVPSLKNTPIIDLEKWLSFWEFSKRKGE